MSTPLARLVDREIAGDAPPVCAPFVAEIRRRFAGVAAVLFYGSCLRGATDEGVLDFYALVDDYALAYGGGWLARANALLPPNVFHVTAGDRHAKVAVVSTADFAVHTGERALRPLVWARFCQPFAVAWLRDEAARTALVASAADALRTAALRGLGLLPLRDDGTVATASGPFWTRLFAETYASELRPESDARVDEIHDRDPARYARALEAALETLADEERLAFTRSDAGWVIRDAPGVLGRRRRLHRWAAKGAGAAALLKSAFTFGDWLPYALWKIERHTGTRLEPTERQRRHPLIFAWPLIFRVLAKRELR